MPALQQQRQHPFRQGPGLARASLFLASKACGLQLREVSRLVDQIEFTALRQARTRQRLAIGLADPLHQRHIARGHSRIQQRIRRGRFGQPRIVQLRSGAQQAIQHRRV
ncbi:hypothetical protein G6F59_016259 [Rhizopus arrhizus]|nr:hypothetical protein G6F59_016259 [Rhizopus arrhizus]